MRRSSVQPQQQRGAEVATDKLVALGLVSHWFIPGYALHEKGLQGQIDDGPLVSSQEENALLVPLINCI